MPSADEIRTLRRARVSAADAKKVRDARRAYEAGLRSGWDSYCGAIEAARGGNVARLVDCFRASKALADGDGDRLAAFIATKLRRRRWPPEVVRALGNGADRRRLRSARRFRRDDRTPPRQRPRPNLYTASRLAQVLCPCQLDHSFDFCEMYGENYGYRSSLNQSMVRHLTKKARELERVVGLQAGDTVLDIGATTRPC